MLSNILLTPFDREMRRRGYQLTRYADDWVITCKSVTEARAAVEAALRVLKQLGVELHPQKTRIVHVQHGFDFLGYKIKRGNKLRLHESKIRSQARSGALYAYPREKSIRRFMCHKASAQSVAGLKPLVSYQTYRLLSGWDFHPEVICALGADSGVLNLRGPGSWRGGWAPLSGALLPATLSVPRQDAIIERPFRGRRRNDSHVVVLFPQLD